MIGKDTHRPVVRNGIAFVAGIGVGFGITMPYKESVINRYVEVPLVVIL